MKNFHLTLFATALFCTSIFSGFTKKTDQPEQKLSSQTLKVDDAALIKRGKYLVGIMGCQDCHSPKRMGARGPEVIPELHLSGYPSSRPVGKIVPDAVQNGWVLFGGDATSAVGPWGVSFAANLTSDESGIGTWTYEQFKTALTQGKYKGLANSRPLLPPMPWTNYTDMADEDIQAVFKYLKSTKPVSNVVPSPISPDQLGK